MPKCNYLKPKRKKLAADYVADLLRRYLGETSGTALAESLGVNPVSVSRKLSKGSAGFTLAELHSWADALKIPPEEIGKAIAKQLQ